MSEEIGKTTALDRRSIVKAGVAGLVCASLGPLMLGATAQAQAPSPKGKGAPEQSLIDESDPQAKALGYRHDAATVDSSTYKRSESAFCLNCQLYSGSPGANSGPCAIFSYRTDPRTRQPLNVTASGWCVSWAPRQGA